MFGWGLLLFTLISVLIANSTPTRAATGINEQINFQGRLLNAAGATVADGNYNMQFKIYQDGDGVPGGGDETLKWTESWLNNSSQGVSVKNGYFSVQLGSITAFGSSVDWNQSVLWLSVNVGSTNGSCTPFSSCTPDGEMNPMKRLASSPYSLNSGRLGGLASSDFVQLAQGLQTDSSNSNASIAINKTGSANLITLQGGGSNVLTVSNVGAVLVKPTTSNDSATEFQVQNAAGNQILAVDTSGGQVVLGKANTGGVVGKLTLNNATNTNTVSIQSGTTSSSYTLTLPTALPGSTQCLQSDNTGALTFNTCGGASGIATKEGGTTIVAASTALNFNASDFTISDEGSNQTGIAIDYSNSHITRDNQTQSISGAWTFTNGLTVTGTTNLNASGSAATNVGTGTGNVAIGNTSGTLSIASSGGLNATTGGALTGVASIDTITTDATHLTFAAGGTLGSSGSSALVLNGGSSGYISGQVNGTEYFKFTSDSTNGSFGTLYCGQAGTNTCTIKGGSSLVLTGASGGNISILPAGSGDAIVTADSDTNFQVNYTSTTDDTIDITHINITDNASASTGALFGLAVVNNDNGANTGVPDALGYYKNANAAETVPDGLLVEQTGAGTLTSGLEIKRTAGTITTALLVTGTGYTDALKVGSLQILNGSGVLNTSTSVVSGSYTGITGTGALDAGSITTNFGAINVGADNITTTGTHFGNTFDRSTAGALSIGTGGSSAATSLTIGSSSVTSMTFTTDNNAANDFTFTGGITGSSLTTTGNVTVQGTTLSLGNGSAATISTPSGGAAISIQPNGTGALNLATTNTGNVAIGNSTGTFALTSSGGLNVTTGGALTGVASIDTIVHSATAITFAAAGTISSTGANNLSLNSGTNGSVVVTPAGTGDFNVATDADSNVLISSSAGNASAFQIQNSSSKNVVTVDTSANKVLLGDTSASGVTGLLVFNTSNNANTVGLQGGATSSSYTLTLPTNGGSLGQCLQNDGSITGQLVFGACNGTAGGLAKNAADVSSASVGSGSFLYAFTNGSSAVTSGVLKLDNGTNTNSALSIIGSGNSAATNAYIYAKNSNASPSGNILELQNNVSSGTDLLTVSATGSVGLKTTTNSTTALQLLNSTGGAVFTIDNNSSPATVQVGSSSTDGNAFLLVLDSYNTTDPTGSNGAMYYSTSTNTFRCRQNSAWMNCIGNTLMNDGVNNSASATLSTASDTTLYSYSVPGNSITSNDGRVLHLAIGGTYTTPANASGNVEFKVSFGGTGTFDGTLGVVGNAATKSFKFDIYIGQSSTTCYWWASGSGIANTSGTTAAANAAASVQSGTITAPDTTTAQTLAFTARAVGASSGTVTYRLATTEVLR